MDLCGSRRLCSIFQEVLVFNASLAHNKSVLGSPVESRFVTPEEFMDVVGPMATETAPSKVLDFLQYVEQAEMPYMAIDNEFRIVEWNSKAAEVSGALCIAQGQALFSSPNLGSKRCALVTPAVHIRWGDVCVCVCVASVVFARRSASTWPA